MNDLVALVTYWQRQLRLQDWDLTVEVVAPHLVPGGGCGASRWSPGLRHARILLADPEQLEGDLVEHCRDIEVTLVHEMVHVAMAGVEVERHSDMEAGIDSVARALVQLNRGVRR